MRSLLNLNSVVFLVTMPAQAVSTPRSTTPRIKSSQGFSQSKQQSRGDLVAIDEWGLVFDADDGIPLFFHESIKQSFSETRASSFINLLHVLRE